MSNEPDTVDAVWETVRELKREAVNSDCGHPEDYVEEHTQPLLDDGYTAQEIARAYHYLSGGFEWSNTVYYGSDSEMQEAIDTICECIED